MRQLKLENLKTRREHYATAIYTGNVPKELITGLCCSYYEYFKCQSMFRVFCYKDSVYKQNSSYIWPTIEESLVPLLNWLNNKITQLK